MLSHMAGSLPAPYAAALRKTIEISRRPRQRRIEVYSPKLKRRITFFSWAAHDAWLLLEADPAVKVFCERPAYLEGDKGRLIDFWVSRGRHAKFWVVSPAQAEKVAFPKSAHGVSVQILRRADLMAFDRRIENWSQILPYRVSFARYPNGRLQKDIFNRLERPHRLERLEAAFHPVDVASVRAALFELLATGKIVSPDLESKPLGLATMFRRASK